MIFKRKSKSPTLVEPVAGSSSKPLIADFREAAWKTANFIQKACPKGNTVADAIREIAANDDPIALEEQRKQLTQLVARLATCGALALELVERFNIALVDLEHAAGELADVGLSMRQGREYDGPVLLVNPYDKIMKGTPCQK